jgi:hypothetical protein
MGTKKIITAAALLVIVGAWSYLFIAVYGLPLREDTRAQQALGHKAAEEAAKLGGAGARFTLITRDTAFYKNPALDAQMKAFHETLTRGGSKVALVHRIKLDPLRTTAVPPGDFLQILKRGSDTDVVVSFLGPPTLTDEQVASLGAKLPKVLAVCSGDMPKQLNLKRMFEQRLLQVAIVSKESATRTAPGVEPPQGWFDFLYTIVTPANLAELPAQTNARP